MVESTMEPLVWLRKRLETDDVDLPREMVATFAQPLMSAEADALCGAPYGERSPDRVNTRNGYRARPFDTRTGTIELQVPKLRAGSYFLRLAPGTPPTRRAGPGGGDRGVLRARGLDAAGRRVDPDAPHRGVPFLRSRSSPRASTRPLPRSAPDRSTARPTPTSGSMHSPCGCGRAAASPSPRR
jgi:hypothetical protein